MWKNANFRLAVGIIGAVIMTVLFVFEIRIGFNIFERKILADTDTLTVFAKNTGSASVSIDTKAVYPEIDGIDPEGDVIKLTNYDLKVKLNGIATSTDRDNYGVYKYAQSQTNAAMTLTVESYKSQMEDLNTAYEAYLYGDKMALANVIGLALQQESAKFMIQNYREYEIPIMYSEGTQIYTAFVPLEEDFLVLSCKDPFLIDSGKVSVHYGDPTANPMLAHTYSKYEELASLNQIRMILDKKLKNENKIDPDDIETPYQNTGVVGTADTYTSKADNQTRAQLVSYSEYKWQEDGVAAGTTMMIDTTSTRAKESEWKLTETVYSYSYAGLQLMNLSGQRTSSNLTISGNIMNELQSDRPYVIVVKFIGETDNLLGLTVIDGRETPLSESSYQAFTATVSSADVKIADVVAVQFEIY